MFAKLLDEMIKYDNIMIYISINCDGMSIMTNVLSTFHRLWVDGWVSGVDFNV